MRLAPPTGDDLLTGDVYVHLRDVPEDGSDPYDENVGDVMHPDWLEAVFTEGLDPGDTHPLPDTMVKAYLGDFIGAGVNWWSKIGKVDDIDADDLHRTLSQS